MSTAFVRFSIDFINRLGRLQPAKLITKLAWRPVLVGNGVGGQVQTSKGLYLAVASEDSSVRLFSITGLIDS